MRQEPRGFQGDTKDAMQLVAADALLRSANQVDRLKPDVHLDVAGLENGPDLDGERPASLVALVCADAGGLAAHLGYALALATLGAGSAMRPDPRLNIVVCGLLIVKVWGAEVRHFSISLDSIYESKVGTSGIITPPVKIGLPDGFAQLP